MTRPYLIHLAVAGLLGMCAHAQTHPLESLIETARTGPSAPGFKDLVGKILTAKGGTAVWGQDFLFVTAAEDAVSISIDGQPPDMIAMPPGCAFAPRCTSAFDRCREPPPVRLAFGDRGTVRCWLADSSFAEARMPKGAA